MIQDIAFLRSLAEKAVSTSIDPAEKWKAHTQIMTWFRSDPVAVIEMIQAGIHVAARPGGLMNQNLHQSITRLPKVERDDQ